MPRLFSLATSIIVKPAPDILHCFSIKWLPSNSTFDQLYNFLQVAIVDAGVKLRCNGMVIYLNSVPHYFCFFPLFCKYGHTAVFSNCFGKFLSQFFLFNDRVIRFCFFIYSLLRWTNLFTAYSVETLKRPFTDKKLQFFVVVGIIVNIRTK